MNMQVLLARTKVIEKALGKEKDEIVAIRKRNEPLEDELDRLTQTIRKLEEVAYAPRKFLCHAMRDSPLDERDVFTLNDNLSAQGTLGMNATMRTGAGDRLRFNMFLDKSNVARLISELQKTHAEMSDG